MLLNTLKDSAITRTELFYQRKQKRHVLFYALLFTLPLALAVISVGFYIWIVIGAPSSVRSLFIGVSFGYSVAVVITHFGIILNTLYVASSAIAREKRETHRWDALILTGVSSRAIVLGKWWAVVRTLWREYLFLTVLRTIAILYLVEPQSFERPQLPPPSKILLTISILGAMTFANLFLTAACGVMSSMQAQRGSGIVMACVVRYGVCILAACAPFLNWLPWVRFDLLSLGFDVVQYAETMLTNGTSFLFNLFRFSLDSIGSRSLSENFPAIAIPLIVYAVLTWALLGIAQRRAERFGALKSAETKGK
jgi:hypothetical protein